MDLLNDDCIECIFSFVTRNIDMIDTSMVCKKFRCLMQTRNNLKSRTICVCPIANDKVIMQLVRGWSKLQIIDCSRCNSLTSESIRLLSFLRFLQSVNFSFCYELTSESFKLLSCSRNLRFVNCSCC